MKNANKSVDFDDYTDRYENLVSDQLAFFSKDRGYFSRYKAALVADLLPESPCTLLDFGCGIGLNLPSLRQYFPHAEIFATDISEKSLQYVFENISDVAVLSDQSLDGRLFDMIFVSGVFHHVPADRRGAVLERLAGLMTDDGHLIIFEHNPFNPVTRHLVSTCPFDDDAELVSLGDMKKLMWQNAALRTVRSGYCLFFPEKLAACSRLDKYLRWLPMGGQYFVVGCK